MGTLETNTAIRFLGMEFITWLCFLSQQEGGRVAIEGFDEFEIFFESPAQLAADYGDATVLTLKGGSPLESPEAGRALLEAKKISRARVRWNLRNQTYQFTVNAERLAVSSLKLPLPPGTSGMDLVLMRMELVEEFEKYLHSLFEVFLARRLDDKLWHAERRRIADWIGTLEPA